MNKKVFGKAEPRCEYCEYGQIASNSKQVLCIKKGIFELGYHCRKFKYDPLKKMPAKAPAAPEFSEEDFRL